MKLLILLMVIWNTITFAMMGIDKYKAKRDKMRISEDTLLFNSFMMGAIGTCIGALVFHHKTKKLKFRIALPVSLIVNGAVIYGLIHFNIV